MRERQKADGKTIMGKTTLNSKKQTANGKKKRYRPPAKHTKHLQGSQN